MKHLVRFDDALDRAIGFARDHLEQLGGHVVIVRDLTGKIRFALANEVDDELALAAELDAQLGGFSAGVSQLLLVRSTLLAPDTIFAAAELRQVDAGSACSSAGS